MAFWCRICQSNLKNLSNQFKRHYLQIPGAALLNSTASRTKRYDIDKPSVRIHERPTEFCNTARSFAAPVQVNPKKEEKDKNGPRMNEQIKAEILRIVFDDGGHIVVSRREALERARKLDLDLVEVQRTADPPVCKIMDFNREKYKQQLKEKERAKSKTETLRKGDHKEIRFSGKTEEKDLRMKADMVKRLMERGYRVKCSARGTEDQDLEGLVSRLSAMIEDVAVVESGPRVEKGQAYVIVRHIKFGLPKKGGGKKSKVETVTADSSTVNFSKLETDNESLSDEVEDPIYSSVTTSGTKKTSWSVADRRDDTDKIFDFGDDANRATLNKVPPIPQGPSIETVNRYAKREPRNRFEPKYSIDNKRIITRDSLGPENKFHDRSRQPQPKMNFSPPIRDAKQVETGASGFRNVTHEVADSRKHEQSRPSGNSTARPGYGPFSPSKVQ